MEPYDVRSSVDPRLARAVGLENPVIDEELILRMMVWALRVARNQKYVADLMKLAGVVDLARKRREEGHDGAAKELLEYAEFQAEIAHLQCLTLKPSPDSDFKGELFTRCQKCGR